MTSPRPVTFEPWLDKELLGRAPGTAAMVRRGLRDPDADLGRVFDAAALAIGLTAGRRGALRIARALDEVVDPRWAGHPARELTVESLGAWYAAARRPARGRAITRTQLLNAHSVVRAAYGADEVLAAVGGTLVRAMVGYVAPVRAAGAGLGGAGLAQAVGGVLSRAGSTRGGHDTIAGSIPSGVAASQLWVTDERLVLAAPTYPVEITWSLPLAQVTEVRRRPRVQLLHRMRVAFVDGSSIDLFTRPRAAIDATAAAVAGRTPPARR